MTRLSPINNILTRSTELKKRQFNVDTQAQQHLLKFAANKDNIEKLKQLRLQPEEQQEEEKVTVDVQMDDKDSVINSIPISKFKPNQFQMIEGKLLAREDITISHIGVVGGGGARSPTRI